MNDNAVANQLLQDLQQRIDSLQQGYDSLQEEMKVLRQSVLDAKSNGNGEAILYIVLLIIAAFLVWRLLKHKPNLFKKNKKSSMNTKKDFEVNYEDDQSSFSALENKEPETTSCIGTPCVAAVMSDTLKAKNQDSYAEAYVEKAQAHIIAIADGVGSSYKAEEASRKVTAKAVELVKKAIESNCSVNFDSIFDKIQIDFDSVFDEVQSDLDAQLENEYPHELAALKPVSFATTLIVGVDLPDRFVAAYVGNGSIWHLSGLFNTFPSMVSLPWNAINLLTPDTIMSGGKEALYKIFFYKGEKKHHKPTVLQISKLDSNPGDLFIITTDGVYSSDHALAAKDEEGNIWIPSTDQFGILHDYLKAYVEGGDDINDETLKQTLERYLSHIKEAKINGNPIMDDDTTLGVFISAEARKHFMDKRKENETN